MASASLLTAAAGRDGPSRVCPLRVSLSRHLFSLQLAVQEEWADTSDLSIHFVMMHLCCGFHSFGSP